MKTMTMIAVLLMTRVCYAPPVPPVLPPISHVVISLDYYHVGGPLYLIRGQVRTDHRKGEVPRPPGYSVLGTRRGTIRAYDFFGDDASGKHRVFNNVVPYVLTDSDYRFGGLFFTVTWSSFANPIEENADANTTITLSP